MRFTNIVKWEFLDHKEKDRVMKKLIEWAEGEVSRGRKLILFSTVFAYIFISIGALFLHGVGVDLSGFGTIYMSFSTVAAAAIGFYTGTTPKKVDLKNNVVEGQ